MTAVDIPAKDLHPGDRIRAGMGSATVIAVASHHGEDVVEVQISGGAVLSYGHDQRVWCTYLTPPKLDT